MSRTKQAAAEAPAFNPLALSVRMLVAGLRNADIADATGRSVRTVEQWKGGVYSPPLPQLRAIAKILRCRAKDLGRGVKVVATD